MPCHAWMSSYFSFIGAALPVFRCSHDCEYCHSSILPSHDPVIRDFRFGAELCFLSTIIFFDTGVGEEITGMGCTFGWNAPRSPDPTVVKGAEGSPGGPGSRGDIPGKPGIWKQKTLTIIVLNILFMAPRIKIVSKFTYFGANMLKHVSSNSVQSK